MVFHKLSCYDVNLFIKFLRQKFNKDDTGVIVGRKEKQVGINVNIYIKLATVTDKDGKEVYKNIRLSCIDSRTFMALSVDKLPPNLNDNQKLIEF